MKKKLEKITLSKETLLNLNEDRLKKVSGGVSKAETLCCTSGAGSRTC
jgi:hypothetical protein